MTAIVLTDTRTIELQFTVKAGLAAHFKKDGSNDYNGNASYGSFVLGMFLPNQAPAVTPAGAQVRTPVYSYVQNQLLCEP